MKVLTDRAPVGELEIRVGGDNQNSFVGFLFLIFGAGLFCLQFAPAKIKAPVVLAVVSVVVLAIGILGVFGRTAVIIDLRKQTIRKWWGLLRPFWAKEYPLQNFTEIRLSKQIYSGKGSQQFIQFRVALAGQTEICIFEERNCERCREAAEQIAKFSAMKLVDLTAK